MTINALNSGAKVWLADLEDANTPPGRTWSTASSTCATRIDRHDRLHLPGGQDLRARATTTRHHRRPAARLAPAGEAHHSSTASRCRAACVDFAPLLLPLRPASRSTRARAPTSTCPRWRATSRRGCGTTCSCSRRTALGIPRGTIRATVLIETYPAAFEMEEILYELREHSAGLNAGRWDYMFSVIKKFRTRGRDFLLPDRNSVTMTVPFMRGLHRAAGAHLPQARRARDRRHGGVHPEQGRGGQRGGLREGPGRQDPRGRRRVRRLVGRPPRHGRDLHGGLRPRSSATGPNQLDRQREDVARHRRAAARRRVDPGRRSPRRACAATSASASSTSSPGCAARARSASTT